MIAEEERTEGLPLCEEAEGDASERAAPAENASVDAAGAEDEITGMAEACRRFPMPADEEAAHALRELSWGEQFVASRMFPSKGGTDLYLYSLRSAALFLLDGDRAHIGKGSDQEIKLIDVDGFVSWVRDVVGDEPLADAMDEDCPPDDPYHDRLQAVQRLIDLRMVQYGGLW
ncbi:hypothetical protein [Gordonibacter sp. 28C]|uniref:hypothetical protein n=1 Tax=Gordonibacter sp. 28C TaxID=2078569 RepID=UPI001F5449D5|nr:hypothetical protein [Gordonibacter sp. 28C]